MVILVDVQVDSRTIVSFNPQSYQGQEEKILRERFPSVLRDEIELLNQLKSMSNEIRFLVSKGENGSHNIALRVCGLSDNRQTKPPSWRILNGSYTVHKGRYAKVNKIIPKSLELILPSSLSVF